MKRAPSVGTPSIYSHSMGNVHVASRSSRSKSMKSLHTPWYKRPMIQTLFGVDIQKLSLFTSVYSVCLSIFTIGISSFDLYCLDAATPGASHTGYYIISFDFVYVGNVHVRNALITIAVFSLLGALPLFFTSIMLIQALTKEHEKKMVPWLITMLAFGSWRAVAFIFTAVVNDMIFAYNILMCLFWIVFTVINAVGWAAVYSLYLELSDLTKLEDMAKLRMGTMTSLATQSMAGSRPTTPHSTTSTMPVPYQ